MITMQQVAALNRMRTSPSEPVVSIYLNLDQLRSDRRAYRLTIRDLTKRLAEQVEDREAKRSMERDLDRITHFLELEVEPRGRGLAVFSCSSRTLWEVCRLPIPLPDVAYVDTAPCVKPLLFALDKHPKYAAVVLEKERARFFELHLGEIVERGEVINEVPRRHKQGGWSQANYQRHHDAHVQWHLKATVDVISKQRSTTGFDRLVIGGTDAVVAEFLRLLPKSLHDALAGTFSVTPPISGACIQREIETLHNRIEQERKARLAHELIVTALKGGQAVVGIPDTLSALNKGQVWQLLLAEGACHPGSACTACDRPQPAESVACSFCSSELRPVRDVTARMIRVALEKERRIDVLRGKAAAELAVHAGVGAFLCL